MSKFVLAIAAAAVAAIGTTSFASPSEAQGARKRAPAFYCPPMPRATRAVSRSTVTVTRTTTTTKVSTKAR